MRLINVSNLESLRLVEFLGDLPKEYAIVSHTWGADEITFEKFNALSATSSLANISRDDEAKTQSPPGLSKIRNAAALAKKQGFDYLWVDTCCINKESSAELSESINSMYQWYQKASICYAFLSDVDERRSLEKSRWFTRGWTLQELIAPRIVEFYDSTWFHIATKQVRRSL